MIPYLFRIFKGQKSLRKASEKNLKKFQKTLKKVLTNQNESDIIYNVSEREQNLLKKEKLIAVLCKGSTADSDSVCWGSNPYTAVKKNDRSDNRPGGFLFVDSAGSSSGFSVMSDKIPFPFPCFSRKVWATLPFAFYIPFVLLL